jgi:hypothetical protein
MNRWFLVVVVLSWICLPGNTRAQEVIYSPYEKFELRNGTFSVVGKINDKVYTYRSAGDQYFLDVFDDSMNRTATVILDFFPRKIHDARFVTTSDRILVLYQAAEGSKVHQYVALLDETGRLVKRPVVLASVGAGVFGQRKDYFSSVVSEDRRTVVSYHVGTKGDELSFSGTWLDHEGNIIRKAQATYKADNAIGAGEALLDNSGNFYITAYTPIGSRGYADQLWLLALDREATGFRPVEFQLDGKYATGSYMKCDNQRNRVYIGGFYSEKKTGNYDGVLFGYYDPATGSMHNARLIAFDDRLRQATGERNQKKAFNDYQVRHLIVKHDGGFVLIAEGYFMTSRNTGYAPGWGYYSMYAYGPFTTPAVREYHYNDIMVLSYDVEGNREWQSFVRKDQYSQEDGGLFSSFALLNTGGALGFLFNDYHASRSRIQLASVDGEGKISMRSLAAGSQDDPDWLPRAGKQVAAREMVIPCLRKRQLCFAKIIF